MDYKEKYEMALEGIQEILGSGEDSIKMSRIQLRLQGIFPELAESEDERIRKVLVELVKCNERCGYFIINNITTSAMLAWLEKQGEQKSIKVPKFKAGDFIQFNGMGHTRYTIKEVCGLSHYINTCDKRMDMSYTDANFELVEQKSAEWSEEDERSIRDSIFYLKSAKKYFEKDDDILWDEKWFNLCVEWLESLYKMLRPKLTWRPSEEEINNK